MKMGLWSWTAVVMLIAACLSTPAVAVDTPADTHNFGADTAKILNLLVYSLYTNPEIFLRELVSNAADAMNKQRHVALTSKEGGASPDTLEVKIAGDKDNKKLVIRDTGIGMTRQELMDNLGNLGASGTKKFLESMSGSQSENERLIGQFGVGFYSAFLVAEKVTVASKADGDADQWVWESAANGTYTLVKDPRGNTLNRGTEITLELKGDQESFSKSDELQKVAKKHSEFIDFPIYVEECKTEKVKKEKDEDEEKKDEDKDDKEDKDEDDKEDKKEEEEEEVTKCEWIHVNEQKPIWLRSSSDVEDEDYKSFFKAITKESEDPLWWSHFSVEGEVEFKALLFIPAKAPFNLFDSASTSMTNLKLYVRRVFITDEFKDLLPRYLAFIRGVVDSDDLPLNVSREMLQESRLLKVIRRRLTRKALAMLSDIANQDNEEDEKDEDKDADKDDKEDKDEEKKEDKEDKEDKDDDKKEEKSDPLYPKLWKEFGKAIRLGVIEDSSNRNRLTHLLRYQSSKSKGEATSLAQYVERMAESQKGIFYLTGESVEKIETSPFLERAAADDVEVLYMDDPIDEYLVGHVTEFSGHKLLNLGKAVDLRDMTAEEKKVDKKRKEAWSPFLKWVKETLGSDVEKVEVAKGLGNTPCVITTPEYSMTAQMERIMKAQALAGQGSENSQSARRILEVNPRHAIIDELRRKWKEDATDEGLKNHIRLLFDIASVQSGFDLADIGTFSKRLHKVVKSDLNVDDKNGDLVEEEDYVIDDDEEDEKEDGDDKDEEKDEDEEKEEKKDDKDEL